MSASDNEMQRKQPVDYSGVVGTPVYFSPEQDKLRNDKRYAGDYSEIDEKVDVYALGLILLELSFNIGTIHERYSIFENLRENHKLD